MSSDRRTNLRVQEDRFITEIISEKPFAASAVDLSHTGIRTVKPISAGGLRGLRGRRLIQLEIPVPEASESIWTTGEIVFESLSPGEIGAGIRFLDMARSDNRLLKDLVHFRRQRLIDQIREAQIFRKQLNAMPTPFFAPPPARRIIVNY